MHKEEFLNKLIEYFGKRLKRESGIENKMVVYIESNGEEKEYIIKEFTQDSLDEFIKQIENNC